MTGIKGALSVANAQQALEKLFTYGCKTVIITLGSAGSVFAHKGELFTHIPVDIVKPVDTTVSS